MAIELDLTYVHCNHFGNAQAADAHADRALALAARAEDRTLHAEALAVRAMVDFLIGRGVDWAMIGRALALEGSERAVPLYLRPSSIAACLKLWIGRHDEAREELTALRLAALDSGDESDLAYLLTWVASLELIDGNLAAAERHVDEAAAHAALAGSEFNRAWALAQRAMVEAYRGDADATRAAAAEATEICARFEATNPMLWVSGALGVLELSLGDAAAAWAALEPAIAAIAAGPEGEPLALVLAPAIEALIALGELDDAARLHARLRREADRHNRAWPQAESLRCEALLLAARGDLAAAHEATVRSLAVHAASTRRWSAPARCSCRARSRAGASRSERRASRSTRRSRCSSRSALASGRSARATRRRASAAAARPT